ncbi:Cytochrome b5 domain-containing protein 1 [Eumeta japonica]|uniref:Cytochrome b5 domain-containing protein 1 n=1 Tax=Eumeta variegata TaxID=151549 RepID=A0A4C1TT72_EUMVA|nr:Cytochrome b5 domain-containing protein 1 [Eumeta japonica]
MYRQEWYTPAEVAVHNTPKDCWVSLNGKVLDLTEWLDRQMKLCMCVKSCSCGVKSWFCEPDCVELCCCFKKGFLYCDGKRLATTILAYAGKDISHWFDGDDWVTYIHPIVGTRTEYQRHGPGSGRPVVPSTRWKPYKKPWWLDPTLVIGKLTAKTRPIRIVNTLTGSTVTIEVCSEETIYQIMLRYLPHNAHAGSYTWRYRGRRLCYGGSLQHNGVPDERERYAAVALPDNLHVPALFLYYNDDLTEGNPFAIFTVQRTKLCRCEVNHETVATAGFPGLYYN